MVYKTLGVALTVAQISFWCIECEGRFTGKIVSDETGESLAAAIHLTNTAGEPVEIEGEHHHVQYLQKQWCYVDGEFVVSRGNVEGWTVNIRRGPETLPLTETIGSTDQQTFKLRRWIDMAGEGYISGDTHVHFLELDQCHFQMRAEDLDVLNLLTSDFTHDVEKFTGDLDPISTPESWVYVGQEFRDWQQGHINLLRLRKLVQPVEPFGGIFRETAYRNFIVSPAAREALAQDAAVTWAHFGDIPGAESPIAIALGLIDAVDLISQGDPTKPPLHWEPWRMEHPAHLSKLPVLSGIDMFYKYLNAGFRIPLASGTDKMSDQIPVGSSRLYVKTTTERSFDGWIEGLKAGNGFITNGPMLTFSVDGYSSGDVVEFSKTKNVVVRCSARSLYRFSRLEIMVNGRVVSSARWPRQNELGIYESAIEFPLSLDESSWVAARVASLPGEGEAIMPRGMKVFAHSNPAYFLRDGAKVRVQESIDYLTLYLRHSQHWFKTAADFETEEARREAIALADKTMDIFQGL